MYTREHGHVKDYIDVEKKPFPNFQVCFLHNVATKKNCKFLFTKVGGGVGLGHGLARIY